MSKHFAFVTSPAHGHVNPTLPLVEELLARGHRVSYATGETLLPAVEKTGAIPVALPWELDVNTLSSTGFCMDNLVALLRGFLSDARRTFPVLAEHFARDRPDLVCYDMLTFIGPMLADLLDAPGVSLVPSFAVNAHFSLHDTLLPADFDPLHPALAECGTALAAFPAEYGLSTPIDTISGSPAPLSLVFLPREFQIAGDTFDDTFRFIGPSLGSRSHSPDWAPPADGAAVLFISLGTTFNDRPDFFTTCTRAFAGSDWHVVMAVGDHVTLADLGEIPANFEIRPYFPQPTVLSHASVFVSHAGMNSTMESLYHQVPLVAVPQMPEQTVNATRIEELGLGQRLDSTTVTAQRLRQAVDHVAADPAIRTNLTTMAERIRASGGPAAGADALEQHLARITGADAVR
jgi:MGT family glycosyltransferase